MMWIAFVRLFFLSSMLVAFVMSLILMKFSANFSETGPACIPQGGCTDRILLAALMLCAPTIAALSLGWWRAERTVMECGEDRILLFRLFAIVTSAAFLLASKVQVVSMPPVMLVPAGIAMLLSWLAVESCRASARR